MSYKVPNLRVCTLEQFEGGNGNAARDQAALTAAFAAMAAGQYNALELGAKTYFVQGGTVPVGATVFGVGDSSILSTTSARQVLLLQAGAATTIRDLQIVGDGSSSTQVGIQNGTGVAASGCGLARITNVSIVGMGDAGIYLISQDTTSAGLHVGAHISGCRIQGCGVALGGISDYGIFNDGCEYVTVADTDLVNNQNGIAIAAGNCTVLGGLITGSVAVGVTVEGQPVGISNDGHGAIIGTLINHTGGVSDAILIESVLNGFLFSDCHIIFGNIHLLNAFGAPVFGPATATRFEGCYIDVASYIFDGSVGTVFDDCFFPSSLANTIINNANGHVSSTKWGEGNTDLAGLFPTFILAGLDGSVIGNNAPLHTESGVAASGGGTFVRNFTVSTDFPDLSTLYFEAEVLMSDPGGDAGRLRAECAVTSAGAGTGFTTVIAGSTNPMNSNTAAYAASHAMAASAGFVGAGPPTAVWTAPGAGVIALTVTNPGANNATVQVAGRMRVEAR